VGNPAFVKILNKASNEVKRDISTKQPPLGIDTAAIFGILKSEQSKRHAKNGTKPKNRFDHRNGVTIMGVARHFGNNPHTVGTYVDAMGELTAKGRKNMAFHYRDYYKE
jgi:hypothetical protein